MAERADRLPLGGRRIVVTRAASQSAVLTARLVALGAAVVEVPVIAIAEPNDGGRALQRAIDDLRAYDWVVLTSPNAAAVFFAHAGDRSLPAVAAIGPGTASAVEQAGGRAALVPGRTIGEGLVDAFPSGSGRVLLPQAAVARDVVSVGLRSKGWMVDVVEAYRTVAVAPPAIALREASGADAIVFTSSSTADAYAAAARREPNATLPRTVVSIGPETSRRLRELGIGVTAEAEPHTLDGLVECVVAAMHAPLPLPAMPITSVEAFQAHVAAIQSRQGYANPAAWAVGIAVVAPSGKVLDTAFPVVNLGENLGAAAVLADVTGYLNGTCSHRLDASQLAAALAAFAPFTGDGQSHPNVEALQIAAEALAAPAPVYGSRVAVVVFIGALSDSPVDAHDVYLRLHLLSHRKVAPHGQSMEGVFGLLNNVVWTDLGPFDPDDFELVRARLRAHGRPLHVLGVDKFPRMTDYVVPSGVRIADASRVRLGAHLAEGTTVMHEGFCNFNAGTLGASMVEGRISAGVVVGHGSDIGGGASIMGTLSGGGKEVVSIGEGCLLGANAGIGIALGDNCIVEAGCYVTAGSRVKLPDGDVVAARALSGASNLLFRRNSQSGALEAIANKVAWTGLNDALHKN